MTNGQESVTQKAALRTAMLQQLQTMSSDDRTTRSEKICARIVDSSIWQEAKSVLLFSPLLSEPQIAPLETAAVAAGKSTSIIPATLHMEAELKLSSAPDLILVPGLAFSRDGHRLGRGGGFFDRLLGGRAASAFKVGVCFAFQLQESIPIEPHDAVMHAIITD